MKYKLTLLVAAVLLLQIVIAVAGVPQFITYQGRLLDSVGDPVADGSYLIRFQIYDDPSAGSVLWSSGTRQLTVTDGLFSYNLGDSVALPDNLFSSGTDRWVGVKVNVDPEITPRTRLTSYGYAYQSLRSDSAMLSTNSLNLNGNPASYYLNWSNLTGVPAGFADGIDNDAGGDITGVVAGLGLSGGGPSGGVTLSVNNSEVPLLFINNTFTQSNTFSNIGVRSTSLVSDMISMVPGDYNSTNAFWGIYMDLVNSSTGHLYGASINIKTDGTVRHGIDAVASANNGAITTGNSFGISGQAFDGANAYGVYGYASSATTNWAGYFDGNTNVAGTLTKGGGAFRIDHPLDPENKILQHSFVESPDMMNIYNGNTITGDDGFVTVTLPNYFDALNRDFRYQLTVIGSFSQAIIANEISENSFVIQTDKPNVKVSWQVTGVRHDRWADANRIQVEVEKNENDRGYYLHHDVWNQPFEKSVDRDKSRYLQERTNSAANQSID